MSLIALWKTRPGVGQAVWTVENLRLLDKLKPASECKASRQNTRWGSAALHPARVCIPVPLGHIPTNMADSNDNLYEGETSQFSNRCSCSPGIVTADGLQITWIAFLDNFRSFSTDLKSTAKMRLINQTGSFGWDFMYIRKDEMAIKWKQW